MDNSSRVIEVDVNDVLPNRNQPRLILTEEDDLGLTDSVKQYGVLQPIIVRRIGDKYEIIAGERRYRASVLAGKETVPVIVRNMTDKESAEIALIENIQRKELTPIEEALSYKNILDLGYLTQEQLADKVGKSQPTIANKIRLLNLSDEVQEALLENKISERHARSLLKLKSNRKQNKMLDRIINERLTVRKTDEEIEKMLSSNDEDEVNERKGEVKMNNEFNNMPQFTNPEPAQPMPQFDIFAGASAEPVKPVEEPQANVFGNIEPVAEPQVASAQPIPQFDIFANAQPATPVEEPKVNVVEPVQPVTPQFNIYENAETGDSTEGSSAPAQSIPQFDIFANAQPVEEPKVNVVEPVQPAAEQPVENTFKIPTYDIFANAQPVEEPKANVVEPVQPAAEQPVENTFKIPTYDIFANAQPAQEEPQASVFENPQPVVEQPVENTTIPQFDIFAGAAEAPKAPVEEPAVLETSPVQESVEQPIAESKPEPIIVTDYNKQYDPVMPDAQPVQEEQVPFKEVISAIRECANKIESYGYKIDLDEFDLTNIYQAIFKIEKM